MTEGLVLSLGSSTAGATFKGSNGAVHHQLQLTAY